LSIFSPYNEFFQILWFTDDNGNKISVQRLNEQHKIVNNRIILKNVPDSFYKVSITSKYEIDINQAITGTSYYKVDYETGYVFFDSSLEGQTITVAQYFGRGIVYIMAKRTQLQNVNNLYTSDNVEDFANEITQRVDNLVLNSGSGDAEIIDSRTSTPTGITYSTLKNRLDLEYDDFVNKQGDNNITGSLSFNNRFKFVYNSTTDSLDIEIIPN